ncbi:dihydroxyacetone kinase family protein [Microbacterium sp. HD4P20]|uniref:dihydroxyacetone kinase family protein n=1 Tax=Microbacterium sp. HD4P20 TaxID=2864874 RepID=UPI001C63CEC2|nr:dihydroxyacetone kinase family protein [Microbacterium sp. HD4P20]MCP2635467.1 dihydroxyacetone kinase family protein [Microbacterium sp. HD4P20]
MTRIANDAADFVPQALAGFVAAHGELVRAVDGGVVRTNPAPRGSVAVVIGGGSGHYPAFAGVVGAGMASGAVCGNIFTSPSAGQAYRVAKAAHRGGGVLYSFGNYAGDVLHFGEAQERLREEGIDARTVLCTDDIASAPLDEIDKRRGIAGDFTVFKIAGAAAERGDSIDEVERLARLANHRTRTLGVAFGGCTFPGADEPLFTVPEGMMSIGLGIHGEPGIRDVPRTSSADLAQTLVDELLGDVPENRGDRVAVIVNGLGTVKYEELFVLFGDVAARLDGAGITVVQPEVGELVTSLDMAGTSVTFFWLDDELEPLWAAPAYTPAYRKGAVQIARADGAEDLEDEIEAPTDIPPASEWSQRAAGAALTHLDVVRATIHEHETELGRIDAIAGDGDHGVGMRTGIDAATDAADPALGLSGMLAAAGDAWSEKAGGTSGALWGAMLRAIGRALDHDDADPRATAVEAARAALEAVTSRGGARVGDKTMVDALDPYVEALAERLDAGAEIGDALAAAAQAATDAAAATSTLRPALGRARPLAEKSLGHPDAGATSLALIATAIAEASSSRPTREEER